MCVSIFTVLFIGEASERGLQVPSILLDRNTRGPPMSSALTGGSTVCFSPPEFPGFLEQLNPGLFREYQWERFHAGTTGGRWNCPHPPEVLNLMVNGGAVE